VIIDRMYYFRSGFDDCLSDGIWVYDLVGNIMVM
jgi:hypothetical protein